MINSIDVAIWAIKATLMKCEKNQDTAYKQYLRFLYRILKEYNESDDEEKND